jgi:hypothetical protein
MMDALRDFALIVLTSPLVGGIVMVYMAVWKFKGGVKPEVDAFKAMIVKEFHDAKIELKKEVGEWKKEIFNHLETVQEEFKTLGSTVEKWAKVTANIEQNHVKDMKQLNIRVDHIEKIMRPGDPDSQLPLDLDVDK